MNFYIDMDGVLVDFEQGFKNIYGETSFEFKERILKLYDDTIDSLLLQQIFDDLFWKMIDIVPNFWINLPPFENIVNDLNRFSLNFPNTSIMILSTIPARQFTYENAKNEKMKWLSKCIKKYPTEIKVEFPPSRYYGEDTKSKYCNERSDILIDDSVFHLKGWKKKGGTAFLFDSTKQKSLYEILEFCMKNN